MASFISEPVLKGFIVGLALTIIIGQVPKLLGVEKTPGNFFEQAWGVIKHLPDIHWLSFLVGLFSLILVLVLKPDFDQLVRFLPAVEPVEEGLDIGG